MSDVYDVYNMVNKELFLSERNMLRKCIVAYTVISQELIPDEYELSRIDTITLKSKICSAAGYSKGRAYST